MAGPGGEYDFFPLGDERQAAAYSAWADAVYPETVPTARRAALGLDDAPNRLKREEDTGPDVRPCGGGRLAGALLPETDELVIRNYPGVAGAGIPVSGGGFDPTAFAVAGRTAFPDGVTLTRLTRHRRHAAGAVSVRALWVR
ncbi:hypothetical protein OG350_33595 [Streptomyces achromogenes]|uniref:Uncharacterized protein n=1 Tax=Streptomyces achromogenes TaxID=67255 RepID=A0ABZ1L269_STRAH